MSFYHNFFGKGVNIHKFYCFFLGNGKADSEEHFLATYELLSNEMSFWLAFFGMLHGSVFEWHSKSELLNH